MNEKINRLAQKMNMQNQLKKIGNKINQALLDIGLILFREQTVQMKPLFCALSC